MFKDLHRIAKYRKIHDINKNPKKYNIVDIFNKIMLKSTRQDLEYILLGPVAMANYHSKSLFQSNMTGTIVVFVVLLGCAWSPLLKADSDTICVQTFNAYGPAYSRDLEKRTAALGDELRTSPCGIVQMQEVWSDTHHNWVLDGLAQSMSSLSGVRFDDVQRPQLGQSGLATFTTEILSGQSFVPFQVNTDGLFDNVRELLGVIKGIGSSMITMRQNEGQKIRLMNVHLHPTSQRVRIAQVVQLLDAFFEYHPLQNPMVITGDFNFEPSSVEYNLLQSVTRLTDAYVANNGLYSKDICTYCESNVHHWPGHKGVLDYIWSRRGQYHSVKHLDTFINLHGVNGVTPSDHFGLRSDVQLVESSVEAVDPKTFHERRQEALRATYAAVRALDAQGSAYEPFYSTRRHLLKLAERLGQDIGSSDPVISNLVTR